MDQEGSVKFGVKRYHPVHGRKKFIVESYDELPTEEDGWFDSPKKAMEHDNKLENLPPEIQEEYKEAAKEMVHGGFKIETITPGVRGMVSKLLKGKTLNGHTGLSLKSFASLYGEVNPKTKKALKPLYEKVIAEYGDKIIQNRYKQYVYKE